MLPPAPPARLTRQGWRGEDLRRLAPRGHTAVTELVNKIVEDPNFDPVNMCPFVEGARLVVFCQKEHVPLLLAPPSFGRSCRSALPTASRSSWPRSLHPTNLEWGNEEIQHGLCHQQILNPDHVLLSVDFSNVFNTVSRVAIAQLHNKSSNATQR